MKARFRAQEFNAYTGPIRIAVVALSILGTIPLTAQPGPGPMGPGPGCNLFPAPPSVGATVDLSYFGPPPSATNSSFVGPVQLLKSGQVDDVKGTVTLPLYKGFLKAGVSGPNRKNVWYILTDVNDANVASFLGINYSAKLGFGGNSARTANFDDQGNLIFDQGTVDFSPVRAIAPGAATPFPPATASPGAIGDGNYNPLVRVLNAGGMIYNASMIAFDVDEGQINFPTGGVDYSRVHDQVIAIDPFKATVTLNVVNGFSFGRPVWYLTLEASMSVPAAIESVTFAPALQKVVLGKDDSFSSPVERLFLAINGPDGGCDNPQRQGLNAALSDGFRPNNVLGGIPTIAPDYSPLWDAQPYEWTPDAVSKGYRGQLREEFQILTLVQDGILTGPGGAKFGTGDFIVNCPPVQRLN